MQSEHLTRYKISDEELLEKLGIKGQLHFINSRSDGAVIIECLDKIDKDKVI